MLSLEDHCGCTGNGGATILLHSALYIALSEHPLVTCTATEHQAGLRQRVLKAPEHAMGCVERSVADLQRS